MIPPDVIDMVRSYLVIYKYDGLYNTNGECGCLRTDLAPCGEICIDCKAGYQVFNERGWEIRDRRPEKEGM